VSNVETERFGRVTTEGALDDLEMTEQERKLFRKFWLNLLQIPGEFQTWMIDRITLSGLQIPITQIQGFSQFTATPATSVTTAETTSSTSYTDLATAGPSLTGLSDGSYLVLYSAVVDISSGAGPVFASPKINATEADDVDALETAVLSRMTLTGFALKSLSNSGNNTVTMRYKVTGATTGRWRNRRLSVLKYANL
jgi:hypothetical protein